MNLLTVVSCQWFALPVARRCLRARDSLVFGVSFVVCRACRRTETGIAVGETSEQGFVINCLKDKLMNFRQGRPVPREDKCRLSSFRGSSKSHEGSRMKGGSLVTRRGTFIGSTKEILLKNKLCQFHPMLFLTYVFNGWFFKMYS